jgi:Lamin Tail Domain
MRLSQAFAMILFCGTTVAAAGCAPSVPTFGGPEAPPRDAGLDPRVPTDAARDIPAPPNGAGPDSALEPPDAPARPRVDGGSPPEPTDAAVEAAPARVEAGRGAPAPERGQILIDEALVDPAGTDLGREWIEIINLADHPVDLAALHVSDGTTDVAVDGGVLAPGALLVLGQSSAPTRNGGAPVRVAYGTRLMLNNDGDKVQVCLGACAAGDVLDELAWSGAAAAAYAGRALVVDPASRAICPANEPFGTEGSLGSPGLPNRPCGEGGGAADGGDEAGG